MVYTKLSLFESWFDVVETGVSVNRRCSESILVRIAFLLLTVSPLIFLSIACTLVADEGLRKAAMRGKSEVVDDLLGKGANVNYRKGGWPVLMFVAREGHTEVARILLRHGADVNAMSTLTGPTGGATPLTVAAEHGHVDIVKLLLAHGADVNARNNHGSTALMYATEYGHPEVVNILLESSADISPKDKDGESALMIAKRRDYTEVVQLLQKAGAIE